MPTHFDMGDLVNKRWIFNWGRTSKPVEKHYWSVVSISADGRSCKKTSAETGGLSRIMADETWWTRNYFRTRVIAMFWKSCECLPLQCDDVSRECFVCKLSCSHRTLESFRFRSCRAVWTRKWTVTTLSDTSFLGVLQSSFHPITGHPILGWVLWWNKRRITFFCNRIVSKIKRM